MEQFTSLIAKLYPFKPPLILNGDVYLHGDEIKSLSEHPLIESMFAYLVNAHHLLIFDSPLLPCEIIGGPKVQVNWLSNELPPASEMAVFLMESWLSDVGRSAQNTSLGIDITQPINEWGALVSSVHGAIPPTIILDNLWSIRLQQSGLMGGTNKDLVNAIQKLIDERDNIERFPTDNDEPASSQVISHGGS